MATFVWEDWGEALATLNPWGIRPEKVPTIYGNAFSNLNPISGITEPISNAIGTIGKTWTMLSYIAIIIIILVIILIIYKIFTHKWSK